MYLHPYINFKLLEDSKHTDLSKTAGRELVLRVPCMGEKLASVTHELALKP